MRHDGHSENLSRWLTYPIHQWPERAADTSLGLESLSPDSFQRQLFSRLQVMQFVPIHEVKLTEFTEASFNSAGSSLTEFPV